MYASLLVGVLVLACCQVTITFGFPNAEIVNFVDERNNNDYHFKYTLSDGQEREEIGKSVQVGENLILRIRGFYTYTGPEGKTYKYYYQADENGSKSESVLASDNFRQNKKLEFDNEITHEDQPIKKDSIPLSGSEVYNKTEKTSDSEVTNTPDKASDSPSEKTTTKTVESFKKSSDIDVINHISDLIVNATNNLENNTGLKDSGTQELTTKYQEQVSTETASLDGNDIPSAPTDLTVQSNESVSFKKDEITSKAEDLNSEQTTQNTDEVSTKSSDIIAIDLRSNVINSADDLSTTNVSELPELATENEKQISTDTPATTTSEDTDLSRKLEGNETTLEINILEEITQNSIEDSTLSTSSEILSDSEIKLDTLTTENEEKVSTTESISLTKQEQLTLGSEISTNAEQDVTTENQSNPTENAEIVTPQSDDNADRTTTESHLFTSSEYLQTEQLSEEKKEDQFTTEPEKSVDGKKAVSLTTQPEVITEQVTEENVTTESEILITQEDQENNKIDNAGATTEKENEKSYKESSTETQGTTTGLPINTTIQDVKPSVGTDKDKVEVQVLQY